MDAPQIARETRQIVTGGFFSCATPMPTLSKFTTTGNLGLGKLIRGKTRFREVEAYEANLD